MTIGERIRIARENKLISQTELSNAIGVSKQSLYKYENGIVTNIPSDKIEAIARITETTPAYLMGWDTDTCHDPQPLQSDFHLTPHEKELVVAYRRQPEMQEAVDKLLSISASQSTEAEKRA